VVTPLIHPRADGYASPIHVERHAEHSLIMYVLFLLAVFS